MVPLLTSFGYLSSPNIFVVANFICRKKFLRAKLAIRVFCLKKVTAAQLPR